MSAPELEDLFSLAGRRVAVTGAGRGIGRGLALGLARAGADLVLLGRRGASERTRSEADGLGCTVSVADLDLSDLDAVRKVGAELAQDQRIDVLINNAGVIERRETTAVGPEEFTHVLDVNLAAVFFLSQAVVKPMLERGAGKVINIASLLSFEGGVRVASYAASKHGVLGLTRAFANEWASRGVQVNALAPGWIVTDNTLPLRDDPQRFAEISGRIPAGRWGEPDDLVGAAIFLASSASDYINGQVLVVDGGWSAR